MAYAVELTLRAERDLDELYEYLSAEHSAAARRWFTGLEKAIFSLEKFPRRCPRAPEARRANWPLRQLLYGGQPDVYRILYVINEMLHIVRVLTIRHGARDAFIARERSKK
jgi:plasmid stabilization system protein ParE